MHYGLGKYWDVLVHGRHAPRMPIRVVSNYTEIAWLMGLSRARVTQIADLLYLAPDIQEEILLLPSGEKPELDVPERAMRPIARIPDWNDQRKLWRGLYGPLIRRKEESDRRDD